MKIFYNQEALGETGRTVLMPGDPLRANYIAETYLEDPVCCSRGQGMNGYTGYYQGRKVSAQGSGMGSLSMGIYAWEKNPDSMIRPALLVAAA